MEPVWPGDREPETPPPSSGPNRLPIVVGLVVVIAGLIAAITFMMIDGDDAQVSTGDAQAGFVVTQVAAAPPVFEPKDNEGDQPFFPIRVQVASFEEDADTVVEPAAIATGLYGGTVDNTCDQDRLAEYLLENPRKGAAWATAQGIEFDELADYIGSLDARVLAADAVVINHGFDEVTGAPIAIESTLEAGTAVLVDENGDIRSRCYCGNPTKPRPPVYREPRCLGDVSLVFSTPGGTEPSEGVTPQIELTGSIATFEGAPWTEIAWGDTDADTGWTPTANLLAGLCAPADVPTAVPAATTSPAPSPAPTTTVDPDPTATVAPTATPAPAATPTPRPTSPPGPQPTATPAPTETPTSGPTATPTPNCPDADGDGVCNAPDNCRDVANPDQADVDGDGVGDACDTCTDTDRDLHCDDADNCPNTYDPSQEDTDRDGVGDVCDNCRTTANANQADRDGNGVGDACEGTTGGNDCRPGSYLGLTRSGGEAKANANDCRYRITRIDDETFIVTFDYVPDRMNWEIDNGIITNITLG